MYSDYIDAFLSISTMSNFKSFCIIFLPQFQGICIINVDTFRNCVYIVFAFLYTDEYSFTLIFISKAMGRSMTNRWIV